MFKCFQLVAMMRNLLDNDNTFGVVTGSRGLVSMNVNSIFMFMLHCVALILLM